MFKIQQRIMKKTDKLALRHPKNPFHSKSVVVFYLQQFLNYYGFDKNLCSSVKIREPTWFDPISPGLKTKIISVKLPNQWYNAPQQT
jgi:hypothetical protein